MDAFADNWAYMKTELNWLDRVLVIAMGRHRRDLKESEALGRNPRDRVTRHWWKGVITLDQSPNYDEYRPGSVRDTFYPGSPAHQPTPGAARPTPPAPPEDPGNLPLPYQDQVAARIRASQSRQIILGLPTLQERLGLTLFEKNIVLLSLAPEVNRRYSRLYGVLQEDEQAERPLVDLALKLFCRNDQEWQTARIRLGTTSPLVKLGFLRFVAETDQPLLTQTLKLADPLVNFLLAERLDDRDVDDLLLTCGPEADLGSTSWGYAPSPVGLSFASSADVAPLQTPLPALQPDATTPNQGSSLWDTLVIGSEVRERLQAIVTQARHRTIPTPNHPPSPQAGRFILITGPQGTGKTLAAQALAQMLQRPLHRLTLTHPSPEAATQIWQSLRSHPPSVILLEDYGRWLGRRSPLITLGIHEWIQDCRAHQHIIMAEGEFVLPLPFALRRLLDDHLTFELPNPEQRLTLWQQAFSGTLALDMAVDWPSTFGHLAHRYGLSGADIYRLAQDAGYYAQAQGEWTITPQHLRQVIQRRSSRPTSP